MMPRSAPTSFLARRSVRAVALLLVCALAGAAWLVLCDPEPRIRARHGEIAHLATEEPVVVGNHIEQLVEIRSTTGLRVRLAVKRPTDPTPAGGRPLAVLLGGQESGRDALRLVGDTRGAVVAALSYPYEGPEKLKGLAVVVAVPRIRAALFDTPAAIQLALDWLLAQPDVDPRRVDLVGVSLGAPFACIAGALDERFMRVWSVHGGGGPYALLESNLRGRFPFAPARHFVAGAAWLLASAGRLAPERWVARIAPRPFIMVNGRDDERISRASVDLLWNAAREPKELVWIDGGHVDPNRVEIVRQLVDMVLARIVGP